MPSPAPGPGFRPQAPRQQYVELKANVHRRLLNRLNLEALAQADRARAESEIRTLVGELLQEEGAPLSLGERDLLFSELVDEVFGLGPLEPLLRDPTVSDILVNSYKHVFVERSGQLERVATSFQDDKHLLRVIDRIVSGVGRRIDDSSPMVDARLADGSRVNAIVPPLAVDGPLLSIRRFPAERLKAQDLVGLKAMTQPILDVILSPRLQRIVPPRYGLCPIIRVDNYVPSLSIRGAMGHACELIPAIVVEIDVTVRSRRPNHLRQDIENGTPLLFVLRRTNLLLDKNCNVRKGGLVIRRPFSRTGVYGAE